MDVDVVHRPVASKPDAWIEPCMHQGSLEYALLWHDPVPFTLALFFAEMTRIPAGDQRARWWVRVRH